MTTARSVAAWILLAASIGPVAPAARGQLGGPIPEPSALVRVEAAPVTVPEGGRAIAAVAMRIAEGWHVNANPAALDYLIPTRVEVAAREGLRAGPPVYPAPHRIQLAFEDSELLVYDGEVLVRLPILAEAGAPGGLRTMRGTVRFQACNDQVCLAPANVPFELQVTVLAGGAPGTTVGAPDTARLGPADSDEADGRGTGFTTMAPDGDASAPRNPIGLLFERGALVAFVSLFLFGLALNLTPCVYPMLGVTLSIFGARRAAPTHQVFGYAALYVLGIAVMYSVLGVLAALTGGLFGGFLQSPVVLLGIGLLLAALGLSMFGLYEIQLPAALLTRLGGTGATSAVGIFASGLMVGIFAAPCIGPPVVALLALVGAKGDPWFGFTSFFTLSLGLGAPYLVLATFSGLLQRLPRSGEWMVWVKKVFGVLLLAVGSFYVLLGVVPKWAGWVLPAALLVGGLYLGFLERTPARGMFRAVRRVSGTLALVGGLAILATAPRPGIAFREFRAEDLQAGLAEGRAAMLDFSADWCVPCHELERFTFTDPRVRELAKGFLTFKVDLTRYDSPQAEQWRQQYRVSGVPTVIFLDSSGNEVWEARVEGFMPPEPFLERMRLAADRAGLRASR